MKVNIFNKFKKNEILYKWFSIILYSLVILLIVFSLSSMIGNFFKGDFLPLDPSNEGF